MNDKSGNKFSTVKKISIEFDELLRDDADKFVTHILSYMSAKNHPIILKRLEVNGGNIHQ